MTCRKPFLDVQHNMRVFAYPDNVMHSPGMNEIAWQEAAVKTCSGFRWKRGGWPDIRTRAHSVNRHYLDKMQHGGLPDDWKPMPTIGIGVREIRIRGSSGIYRVIHVAGIGSTIHVLHAFQKKTQRTHQSDVELARQRFRNIQSELRD